MSDSRVYACSRVCSAVIPILTLACLATWLSSCAGPSTHGTLLHEADPKIGSSEPTFDSFPEPKNIEVRETFSSANELTRREEGYINRYDEFVLHGTLTNYWPSGGIKSQLHYVHGLRHGDRIATYEDGQKWSVGFYIEDRPHGAWITWYPDGKPAIEFHVDHGAFHGPHTEWHSNGQMKIQFEYVRGKKQGLELFWDENGYLLRTIEWLDGKEQP